MNYLFILIFTLSSLLSIAQTGTISGTVVTGGQPLEFANVVIRNTALGSITRQNGSFTISNVPYGRYTVSVSAIGYESQTKQVIVSAQEAVVLHITLAESASALEEVVISGTMKEVSRLESPVPVEVYSSAFFKANPTPSVFESLQNVNGVRPQLNCNVCNTGDIHINGLEGPYTMILIDGMPIVSGLSTVYGLTGIPQSLIERM